MTEDPNEPMLPPDPDPAVDEANDDSSVWSTGDARVDDAVGRLGELDNRDLVEHADVFDAIQRDLADVLDDAGTSPATSPSDSA